MLHRLENPMVDREKERKARRLAYKVFNGESFERVLEEQGTLQLRPRALFRNNDEVPDVSEMEAEEALAVARVRARKPASRPTSRSFIDIGLGEGRCTREVELIWLPSIYSQSSQ